MVEKSIVYGGIKNLGNKTINISKNIIKNQNHLSLEDFCSLMNIPLFDKGKMNEEQIQSVIDIISREEGFCPSSLDVIYADISGNQAESEFYKRCLDRTKDAKSKKNLEQKIEKLSSDGYPSLFGIAEMIFWDEKDSKDSPLKGALPGHGLLIQTRLMFDRIPHYLSPLHIRRVKQEYLDWDKDYSESDDRILRENYIRSKRKKDYFDNTDNPYFLFGDNLIKNDYPSHECTLVHELGHMVEENYKRIKGIDENLKTIYDSLGVSEYSCESDTEHFAECWAAYRMMPEILDEKTIKAFDSVVDIIRIKRGL